MLEAAEKERKPNMLLRKGAFPVIYNLLTVLFVISSLVGDDVFAYPDNVIDAAGVPVNPVTPLLNIRLLLRMNGVVPAAIHVTDITAAAAGVVAFTSLFVTTLSL